MQIDEAFQRRVFTLDVDKNKPMVEGERSVSSNIVLHEVSQELFNSFGRELLRLDINRHQIQQRIINDPNQTMERRYYVSTQARRVFKRLMVATKMDNTSLSTVEIASELMISHKAAAQLVTDALGFKVIETITLEQDVCEETGAVIKERPSLSKKRYRATQDWMNSFLNNGCCHAYETGEQITRARTLYSEYHRFMVLTQTTHGTGSYNNSKKFPDMRKFRAE